MRNLLPPKLAPGDLIGVVAPSDPIHPDQQERMQEGIACLKSMGFSIQFGQHIFSADLDFAATPGQKAQDINEMFANSAIKAILCAQGGETANATLSLLNWEIIRNNPKIFLGISDITVLLNAIYHKTGLVTFHGTDLLWGFGNNLQAYEREAFLSTLIAGRIGLIPPNQPRQTVRSGQAQGKLLGGNLGCLQKLAGTPYWPEFVNAILFIEAYQITAKACHSAFHQLQQIGLFDQICGAIVGYIDSMQRDDSPKPHMEEVLEEVTHEYDFPILKMNDFGHNCPNTILPIGGEVFMDSDKGIVELVSPCVV
jgi:muramoyltetrapeptide carboxypeptidase